MPALVSINNATKQAKAWLKDIKPDAVIGFGCYVSLAICRAAKQLKIPYAVHEQNSVMGMANKYLSKSAAATCLTYDRADTGKCNNVIITGNPVRSNFFTVKKEEGRKILDIPSDAIVLTVFGGSLGAKQINKQIVSLAEDLLENKQVYIVHITGKAQYDDVKKSLQLSGDKKNRYKLLSYQDKMAQTLAATDVCVSRAGASTLAELCAMQLPSLLVPYPHATENHQYYNAKTLFDKGCVMYVKDEDVVTDDFKKKLFKLVDDKDLRDKMRKSYKDFDSKNSASKLADILENL